MYANGRVRLTLLADSARHLKSPPADRRFPWHVVVFGQVNSGRQRVLPAGGGTLPSQLDPAPHGCSPLLPNCDPGPKRLAGGAPHAPGMIRPFNS